jgi:hypothetical protein
MIDQFKSHMQQGIVYIRLEIRLTMPNFRLPMSRARFQGVISRII